MAIERTKLAHIWQRDEYDWYVEPRECTDALLAIEQFKGNVWDPACGSGNIVKSCQQFGLEAFGTDIRQRSFELLKIHNFLDGGPPRPFKNIICNPPFGSAEEFVRLAISLTPLGGKIAMILPLVWMAGFSSKRDWLPSSPLKAVFPISPRPSMPPGAVIEAGVKPGNGTKDFAWFLWEVGYSSSPQIVFLNTKHSRRGKLEPARGKNNEGQKQWDFAV